MTKVLTGTVHELPSDLRQALIKTPKAFAIWQDITPLARNEWICWVTSGKKSETRAIRIKKGLSKLSGGMRRPCCWVGCTHRADKSMSRSQKFVLSRS
jgi:uncharacterized protein YdeI (YjbR/CyaY-like superfamily)